MSDVVDRLLALWTDLPADDEAAVESFRQLYADPVRVNGAEFSAAGLVGRARTLGAAFEGLKLEVIDEFEAPDRVVVVHRMTGRHVGPLPTPLGEVAGTGRLLEGITIDVLFVADDRITDVWVTGDDLARLVQLDAVRLTQP